MSDAIKETVKSLAPQVYADLAQPAVREVGDFLGESVHAVLSIPSLMILPLNEALDTLRARIRERFARMRVPPDAVRIPTAEIAAPVIQMWRFGNQDETLREMYLNLLAGAMDARVDTPHPAFVDVVRQLSPYEARLVPLFRTTDDALVQFPLILIRLHSPDMNGGYNEVLQDFCLMGKEVGLNAPVPPQALINLQRLGIIEIDRSRKLADPERYQPLELHPDVRAVVDAHANATGSEEGNWRLEISRYFLSNTPFGYGFANACTVSDTRKGESAPGGITGQAYGP